MAIEVDHSSVGRAVSKCLSTERETGGGRLSPSWWVPRVPGMSGAVRSWIELGMDDQTPTGNFLRAFPPRRNRGQWFLGHAHSRFVNLVPVLAHE